MSHAMQGHLRQMGHSEEFWQDSCPLEEGMQTAPVFLLYESHDQYERQKDMTPKNETPKVRGVQFTTWGRAKVNYY